MSWFFGLLGLYFLLGWLISLLAERFKKERIFSTEWYDDRPTRFLFVMFWPLAFLIYIIACIVILAVDSGVYDKLVKKIRGF